MIPFVNSTGLTPRQEREMDNEENYIEYKKCDFCQWETAVHLMTYYPASQFHICEGCKAEYLKVEAENQ